MKRLDRFILKSFIGPFAAILLVVIFILMMQFLWLYIDELVGKGLGIKIILEFLFWGICTILPLAMPLATLLASMMTLGSLGENNELLAMKAAGIPLTRIMVPLTAAALCIAVAAYFVGNNLVPKAYDEIYTLRDDIGRTKEEIKIPSGVFYEGIEGYIMRVEEQDDKTGILHKVMVYNHSGGRGNTSLTLADSALIKLSKSHDYLTFTLYGGASYQEDNKMDYRDTTLNMQRMDFDRQELVIPLKNYSFEKSDSTRFSDQVKCLRFKELKADHDTLVIQTAKQRDMNYRTFVTTVPLERRRQLDTISRSGDRVVFQCDSLLEFGSDKLKLAALEQVAVKLEEMGSNAANMEMTIYESNFYRRHTDVELLKKFAQALACLLMFLIGAPLGALIGKGGLGSSAIISVLFFVLYWVVDISGTKLANDGAASASVGVFISSYVLLPIGLYLTWKATHDSKIFNGKDSMKTWWKMIVSKVGRFFRPARIVFMGTPEFAVASLDALRKAGYKVVGVVTVADKPSGRGLKLGESAVKKYAVDNKIPVLQPLKLKDPEFLSALAAWRADLFVVVAFRMLPEEVWNMPRLGTFNLHAALLPQYRGAAPINWAVINGERHTGITTFMLDKDIDTGGILLRQECPIGPRETAGEIHDKLMELGSKLVVQTVEGLMQHNLEPHVQREYIQGDEVLKPAPKLNPENCRIDWSKPAKQVHNLIRGLSPYPTAWTTLVSKDGESLNVKIFNGKPSEESAAPGTVITDGKTRLCIACGSGAVEITDIQLSGKKRMDTKAFLAGWREPEKYKAV